MANTHSTLTALFTDIANSIRDKKGSKEPITANNFPTEIENLKTGFDYINSDISSIPDYAFYCSEDVLNVNVPNVSSIGVSAFEGCTKLKTIILYDNVVSVGENAFKDCSDELTIYCETTSKPEGWSDNWNPDDCEVVWGFAAVETWDISATEEDNVVAKLYNDVNNEGCYSLVISGSGHMAEVFYNADSDYENIYRKKVVALMINKGILNVGRFAYHAVLKSVILSSSIIAIDRAAFDSCKSLTSIIIPNDTTRIGDYAFNNCVSLVSINIPDNVLDIGNSAFYSCISLTSIVIPDSVTYIDGYAFYNCTSLTSIIIPDSVTYIGNNAFYNTAYYNNSSNWENNVLYIDNALIDASPYIKDDYIIKDGATIIANEALMQCLQLTSVTIPNSVTSIGNKAFQYCQSLVSIAISDSVTRVGGYAFYGCTSLTSINYTGTIIQWNDITLNENWNGDTPDYTIYCTDGTISKDGTITYYNT